MSFKYTIGDFYVLKYIHKITNSCRGRGVGSKYRKQDLLN